MSKKVLFIGLTTIDIQHFVDKYPASNTKIKGEYPLINVGGPAANAAITASFLGADVDFLSIVGENTFTQFIYKEYEKYGVHLIDAMQGTAFDPIFASVITEVENSHRTIFTHHPVLKEHDYSETMNNLLDKSYDAIFIDGFYPELAIPILEKKHCNIIFDGGSWKEHLTSLLDYVDIAICSDNFKPPLHEKHSEVFDFLAKHSIEHRIITRGDEAILYQSKHGESTIDIEKVDAIDTLAAGDIFHGSFVHSYLETEDVFTSLKVASEIATYSTTLKGPREWMKLISNKRMNS